MAERRGRKRMGSFTLPCRGRVGLPKAVRGGVTATPRTLIGCHPHPDR